MTGYAQNTPPDGAVMTFWVIFDRPGDFPDKIVLRPQYVLSQGRGIHSGAEAWLRDTIEDARALLPPGLHRLPRNDGDPPHLVEVWI